MTHSRLFVSSGAVALLLAMSDEEEEIVSVLTFSLQVVVYSRR